MEPYRNDRGGDSHDATARSGLARLDQLARERVRSPGGERTSASRKAKRRGAGRSTTRPRPAHGGARPPDSVTRMTKPPVELHVVSDATGETAARLVQALEAQFP